MVSRVAGIVVVVGVIVGVEGVVEVVGVVGFVGVVEVVGAFGIHIPASQHKKRNSMPKGNDRGYDTPFFP